MNPRLIRAAMLSLTILGPMSRSADAALTLSFLGTSNLGGGVTAFDYSVAFDSEGSTLRLEPQTFVAIYDVATRLDPAFVVTTPAGWTSGVLFAGPVPSSSLRPTTDRGDAANALFQYVGAASTTSEVFTGFRISTTSVLSGISEYGSRLRNVATQVEPGFLGTTTAPRAGPPDPNANPLPEPSTLAGAAIGLGCLGLVGWRRRVSTSRAGS